MKTLLSPTFSASMFLAAMMVSSSASADFVILSTSTQHVAGYVSAHNTLYWDGRVDQGFGESWNVSEDLGGSEGPSFGTYYAAINTFLSDDLNSKKLHAYCASVGSFGTTDNVDIRSESEALVKFSISEFMTIRGSIQVRTVTQYRSGTFPMASSKASFSKIGDPNFSVAKEIKFSGGTPGDLTENIILDSLLSPGIYELSIFSKSLAKAEPGVSGNSEALGQVTADLTITPVPEPTSMIGIGLGVLLIARRRNQ